MLKIVVVNTLPIIEMEPLIICPVDGVAPIPHVRVASLSDLSSDLSLMFLLETSHVFLTEVLSSLSPSDFPLKIVNKFDVTRR